MMSRCLDFIQSSQGLFVKKLCDQSQNLLNEMFLAKHRILQVGQPPYLQNLAPGEFFLFPKKKIQRW